MSFDAPASDDRPALNKVIRVLIDSLAYTSDPTLEEVTESGLLADIRERGILNPPIIRETPDGPKRGEIMVGNRRTFSFAALGHSHIEVVSLGAISPKDAIRAIVLDHTLHREMGSSELFGYVVSYMRATGCKASDALQALNIRGSNRTKLLTVLTGPEACVQAVLKGEVAASTGYELMHRVRVPAEQVRWFGEIREKKLTRQEVIDLLRPKGRKPQKASRKVFEFTDYQPYIAALEQEAARAKQAQKNGVSREAFGFEMRRK